MIKSILPKAFFQGHPLSATTAAPAFSPLFSFAHTVRTHIPHDQSVHLFPSHTFLLFTEKPMHRLWKKIYAFFLFHRLQRHSLPSVLSFLPQHAKQNQATQQLLSLLNTYAHSPVHMHALALQNKRLLDSMAPWSYAQGPQALQKQPAFDPRAFNPTNCHLRAFSQLGQKDLGQGTPRDFGQLGQRAFDPRVLAQIQTCCPSLGQTLQDHAHAASDNPSSPHRKAPKAYQRSIPWIVWGHSPLKAYVLGQGALSYPLHDTGTPFAKKPDVQWDDQWGTKDQQATKDLPWHKDAHHDVQKDVQHDGDAPTTQDPSKKTQQENTPWAPTGQRFWQKKYDAMSGFAPGKKQPHPSQALDTQDSLHRSAHKPTLEQEPEKNPPSPDLAVNSAVDPSWFINTGLVVLDHLFTSILQNDQMKRHIQTWILVTGFSIASLFTGYLYWRDSLSLEVASGLSVLMGSLSVHLKNLIQAYLLTIQRPPFHSSLSPLQSSSINTLDQSSTEKGKTDQDRADPKTTGQGDTNQA
jgi:hypothetical protein